jgi:hypothetical protein
MPKAKNPVTAGDGDARHGRYTTYLNHGCRCYLCSEAHRVYMREYQRKVSRPLPPPPSETPGSRSAT